MSDEMKAGETPKACGCAETGGKCPCGGNRCCCGCIKKAICALVLLLLGGVIGYFMGTHCAYAHCQYKQMGEPPMGNAMPAPVDNGPRK